MTTTCTETCRVRTVRGVPVSLSVAGCECPVPCSSVPAADVAAALTVLGFEVVGHLCWVDRTLSILAVRRRS
jgi:hypothetical protein